MHLLSGVFVVAGCVAGVIGIVMAVRHQDSEDTSKWIGGAIGLLAIGALLSTL